MRGLSTGGSGRLDGDSPKEGEEGRQAPRRKSKVGFSPEEQRLSAEASASGRASPAPESLLVGEGSHEERKAATQRANELGAKVDAVLKELRHATKKSGWGQLTQ